MLISKPRICFLIGLLTTWGAISPVVDAQTLQQVATPREKTNLFLEGLLNFHLTNYQKAIEDFTKVIQRQPQAAEGYYYRGLVYAQYAQGKPPQPGGNLPGCKRINDYIISCEVAVSLNWVKQNKNNAIQDFTRAIQINYNYAEAYHQRGLVQEEPQKKIDDLNRAIALYSAQGMAELEKLNHEKAASAFEQAERLDDLIIYLKSISVNSQEKPDNSIGNSVVSRIKEKSAQEYFKQANSLLRRGDITAALSKFKIAANLFNAAGNMKRYQATQQIIAQLERR